MNRAVVFFALLFGFTAGCAPASVLHLVPEDPIARSREERRIEQRTAAGVGVAASFVRVAGEHLVFMVTVANGSDSRVLVALLAAHRPEPDPCGCCEELEDARERERAVNAEPATTPHDAGRMDLGTLREEWGARALCRGALEPWTTVSGLVAFPALPVREVLRGGDRLVPHSVPGHAGKECVLFLHGPLEARPRSVTFQVSQQ